jgi:two-component system, NtrC family, response regulator GlrR
MNDTRAHIASLMPLLEKPTLSRRQVSFLAHERDRAAHKRPRDRAGDSEQVSSSEEHAARFGKLIGNSAPMLALYSLLRRASATDSTVLIEGETGTGKEVTAQAIHDAGVRRDGPFIVVDCGAIPGQLLESELFGYERGAFTGAVNSRAGAFEAANGGSIFLDEVGELNLDLQPKLLRVLESRTIKRVGTNHHVPVDVRVLAATNRNLQAEVKAKRFRSDLFYRLAVVHVKIPPLRDRVEDIPLLVRSILSQLGVIGSPLEEVLAEPELEQFLSGCSWPGNVRQLRNYLEQRLALGSSIPPPASDSMFPPNRTPEVPALPPLKLDSAPASVQPLPEIEYDLPLKAAREQWNRYMEIRYLQRLLEQHAGNITAAAKSAGVNRVHLYRLLWKHGLRGSDAD